MLIIIPILLIIIIVLVLMKLAAGAPYIPSYKKTVEKIVAMAEIIPGAKAADLGSGDGRIVIALARAGAEAHGFEFNPFLVWRARRKIAGEGLQNKAFIHWKNFWHQDLSSFDIITVFGINYIMKRLEKKLAQELKPGAKVISNGFTFQSRPEKHKDGGVYLYEF